MIHLATGIVIREGRLLLVASRYPNHAEPLWNLPGGRQQSGELLAETVVREFYEETALRVEVREVAYVSESYDGEKHYLNVTFEVAMVGGESSFDKLRMTRDELRMTAEGDDHVAAVEWVALEEVATRIVVGVVREPLIAYLDGKLERRYAGFHDAGVTIEWPTDSR